jgi:chemotaxis family two-component system sensor kinase Cph1
MPLPNSHHPSRRHGERRHYGRRLEDLAARNPDADRLLHDLKVHQVELEMQNEELRRARAATEAALDRYTELYDRAPVGYFTLGPGGSILQLNLAAARLLGGERNRIVGKAFRQFVVPEERAAFSAFLAGVMMNRDQAGCELDLRGADPAQPVRCIRIEAAVISGSSPDINVVAVDVTAKNRSNEELLRSNLELKQYAYIAAHDLQTPLRSISGFAQLLQEGFGNRMGAEADGWIDQMVYNVHRMQTLIRDLLEYSSVDSRGRIFAPTDLGQVVDEVAAAAGAAIRESGATVSRGDLPTVAGDRLQLAQVFQNLIDNAIKYRSGNPPRIHVSARREEDGWTVAVEDNGIGIAGKHQEDVFEIFRRLHSQHAYPGTGIGLAVCQRVVERHGGRIWVESEPGKGSVFRFTLPDRPGG